MKIEKIATGPPTKGASPVVQFEVPGDAPPRTPKIIAIPAIKNTITVTTLIVASQNSPSP